MTTPDILLDTSALIAFLRGDGAGHDARKILAQGRAVISAISVYELFAGVRSEVHRGQRIELVALTRVVPLDEPISRRAADLFTALRRRGITVDNEDLIIAATALERGIAVLTENARHFEAIPDVRLALPGDAAEV
ncbi:MAG: type II toxin-antitoxin system VapC family toxin [Spirochaeta sp.]|jgi:tRNA(fMet)-specific endonuclease VapC|nr:type II toxin-antitoxin system VapC family toxin [Spirochaeta sp.]